MLVGAAWIALAGPMMMAALQDMVGQGLTFDAAYHPQFRSRLGVLRLLAIVALPLLGLFALTLVAAIGAPAMLGSLGFRAGALAFKGNKLNPLTGMKRIFGMQGLIELGKSIAKVLLLGGVGLWLVLGQTHAMIGLGAQDIRPALAGVGAQLRRRGAGDGRRARPDRGIDVPAADLPAAAAAEDDQAGGQGRAQADRRLARGSQAAIRRRQYEVARNSARGAIAEATVVLTNPTHFAVALRYRPGVDAAPARGRARPRRHRRGDPRARRRA